MENVNVVFYILSVIGSWKCQRPLFCSDFNKKKNKKKEGNNKQKTKKANAYLLRGLALGPIVARSRVSIPIHPERQMQK